MMSKQDDKCSSGNWVGDLYQKFEAVCQEVDDIVSHEHMKKLENHVQLVGDNVMKFCSNVRDLIPSSFGAPVKHVAESVNCVFELEDGDGDCPSVTGDLCSEDNLQICSFTDPTSLPSGLKLVQSDPFLLNLEDCEDSDGCFITQGSEKQAPLDASELICHENSLITENSDSFTNYEEEPLSNIPEVAFPEKDSCEEVIQSSELSEVIFTDGYFIDQSFGKRSPFDGSELTCHESSLIPENSDSFTKKEEELLSNIRELSFLDQDPCEEEKQASEISEISFTDGYFTDQGSEKQSPFDPFTEKEKESLSNLPELAFPDEDPCEMSRSSTLHNQSHDPGDKVSVVVSASAFEHISGSELHQQEEIAHDSRISDSFHENTSGYEFQLKEEIVLDSLSKSFFDVSIANVPYSLLDSSVTSSDSETSNVRLASSINSPLLDFSDHHKIEFHHTKGPTYNDVAVEIGSSSTSSLAFQSSESFSCNLSPNENTGYLDSSLSPSSSSMEFTEIPILSDSGNGGLEFNQMEIPIVSPGVDKCWLPKKKFRGPFSSRKKLEKEYKQLSIWYCDIDAEFNEVSEETPILSSGYNKHQSGQDLQESEWELL